MIIKIELIINYISDLNFNIFRHKYIANSNLKRIKNNLGMPVLTENDFNSIQSKKYVKLTNLTDQQSYNDTLHTSSSKAIFFILMIYISFYFILILIQIHIFKRILVALKIDALVPYYNYQKKK